MYVLSHRVVSDDFQVRIIIVLSFSQRGQTSHLSPSCSTIFFFFFLCFLAHSPHLKLQQQQYRKKRFTSPSYRDTAMWTSIACYNITDASFSLPFRPRHEKNWQLYIICLIVAECTAVQKESGKLYECKNTFWLCSKLCHPTIMCSRAFINIVDLS